MEVYNICVGIVSIKIFSSTGDSERLESVFLFGMHLLSYDVLFFCWNSQILVFKFYLLLKSIVITFGGILTFTQSTYIQDFKE